VYRRCRRHCLAARRSRRSTAAYVCRVIRDRRAFSCGKIAQIGSRLIDAAAAKVAQDFFAAFEVRLSTPQDSAAAATPVAPPAAAAAKGLPGWAWATAVAVAAVLVWLLFKR
jgi:uncharacterized protein